MTVDKKTGACGVGGEMGLASSPKGDELWFAAGGGNEPYALRAVDLSGHQRVLLRAPTIASVLRDDVGTKSRDQF
jgi:hypothetical protein